MVKDITLKRILKIFNRFVFMVSQSNLFFNGMGVECPCCGWKGRKFMSTGVISRDNALCPRCGSLERHRLYYLYLKENLRKDEKLNVLHFAPEKCISDLFKSYSNVRYLSADIEKERAMSMQDITNLSFRDNSFDVIFCSHVLEHVPNDKQAMKELHRVLKKEGFALIQVPVKKRFNGKNIEKTYEDISITDPSEREKLFGQRDHVRIYGQDFKDRLKRAGFKVEIIDYAGHLGSYNVNKYALIPDEKDSSEMNGWVYLCTK